MIKLTTLLKTFKDETGIDFDEVYKAENEIVLTQQVNKLRGSEASVFEKLKQLSYLLSGLSEAELDFFEQRFKMLLDVFEDAFFWWYHSTEQNLEELTSYQKEFVSKYKVRWNVELLLPFLVKVMDEEPGILDEFVKAYFGDGNFSFEPDFVNDKTYGENLSVRRIQNKLKQKRIDQIISFLVEGERCIDTSNFNPYEAQEALVTLLNRIWWNYYEVHIPELWIKENNVSEEDLQDTDFYNEVAQSWFEEEYPELDKLVEQLEKILQ